MLLGSHSSRGALSISDFTQRTSRICIPRGVMYPRFALLFPPSLMQQWLLDGIASPDGVFRTLANPDLHSVPLEADCRTHAVCEVAVGGGAGVGGSREVDALQLATETTLMCRVNFLFEDMFEKRKPHQTGGFF